MWCCSLLAYVLLRFLSSDQTSELCLFATCDRVLRLFIRVQANYGVSSQNIASFGLLDAVFFPVFQWRWMKGGKSVRVDSFSSVPKGRLKPGRFKVSELMMQRLRKNLLVEFK